MSPRPPRLWRARISGLLALAISLLAAAPASSQLLSAPATTEPATPNLIDRAEESGAIDVERASLYRVYALSGDPRLPAAYESNRPWRGTLVDLELRRDLPKLDAGPERRAVTEALRAAPDPNTTTCSTSGAIVMDESIETDHFYIQYSSTAPIGGGLTIQDYADSLEESYAVEIDDYGWAEPPQGPAAATDIPDKYHVRVEPLGPGLCGFVSSGGTYAGTPPSGNNPNTPWAEGDARGSCMVLNSDFETGFPPTPQAALDATTAHEYNHSIQFGYGALDGSSSEPDINFSEGGATWMEDEAQDGANDNYNYLYPAFDDSMNEHDEGNEYAYWLTFRGLTERFGVNTPAGGEDVLQRFWELTSQNAANNLTAMQQALSPEGVTLASAYHDYAVAAKFMETCGGGYQLPYCFQEAQSYVDEAGETDPHGSLSAVDQSHTGQVEDNYALNWVTLPADAGTYAVSLSNNSAGGTLRGTMACDTGTEIRRIPLATPVGGGGAQRVSFDSSGCQAAAAVVTNETQTAPNPNFSAARSYTVGTGASAVESTSGNTDTGATTTTPVTPSTSVADTTRPVLSNIGFSSRRFRAARSGAAIKAAAPLGTRTRYRLDEAATVTVRYERKTTGRRVGGRCRAATHRNSKRAKCTRWVLVRGTARHRGKAGANAFRLTGRMNGRALRRGVYRLRLSARDAARNTSKPRRSASFRIVRR